MNHVRHALATAFGVGVAVSVSLNPRVGIAAGCACGSALFLFNALWDTATLLFGKRERPVQTTDERHPAAPSTTNGPKYIDVDNWETSHPELPYVLSLEELGLHADGRPWGGTPNTLSPRQIDLRRQYIRKHCVGKYGIFVYENDQGQTDSSYGFSDEKFALSLKMGVWPHEL